LERTFAEKGPCLFEADRGGAAVGVEAFDAGEFFDDRE
jgi:hypothetical protein